MYMYIILYLNLSICVYLSNNGHYKLLSIKFFFNYNFVVLSQNSSTFLIVRIFRVLQFISNNIKYNKKKRRISLSRKRKNYLHDNG